MVLETAQRSKQDSRSIGDVIVGDVVEAVATVRAASLKFFLFRLIRYIE